MWYLGITTTRMIAPYPGAEKERGEFAVQRQLEDMGVECIVPRAIDFIRSGKKRFAEAKERPYLSGYVFANIPAWIYVSATQARGLSKTLMAITPQEMRNHVTPFINATSDEYQKARRIVERNDRAAMCQFKPGQALDILSGPFADKASKFTRMVERAGQFTVEFETEFFGRTVRVEADPLDVRAAS